MVTGYWYYLCNVSVYLSSIFLSIAKVVRVLITVPSIPCPDITLRVSDDHGTRFCYYVCWSLLNLSKHHQGCLSSDHCAIHYLPRHQTPCL